MTVRASGFTTVNALKLLVYQATEPAVAPSQQVLYLEGVELGDADADLASLGVVPRATLQLFVDSSVEADVQAALDALSQQTSDERHGKPRRAEDGFAGSALLASSFAAPAATVSQELA